MSTPDWSSFSCAAVSIDGGVAEVTLRARGKANVMGPAFWREMPELFRALHAAEEVRAVVLTGEGASFSFGLDLPGMAPEVGPLVSPEAGPKARGRLLELIEAMQQATTAVARCQKPVIAAIAGWCIGGGVDLITACDVRLCARDARFGVREVKLAMVPDVGTLARLPAIVGQGVARELAMTGDDFDAERALRIGLVSEIYADADAVREAAREMARRIAKNSPLAVQGIKQVMNAESEVQAAASLRTAALWNAAFLPSKDVMEAITAFIERREPRFSGG